MALSFDMHRRHLLDLLARYGVEHPAEAETVAAFVRFVSTHPECFERRCVPGHVTGSAWILSPDRGSVLLTHHRKLDRWLQLGGHADGDPDPLSVSLREAREESGLVRLTALHGDGGGGSLPLDLDIHAIPARGDEPAHLHHDVRFLLVAAPGQTLSISEESKDLRWLERSRLGELVQEESMLRMERKARRILSRLAIA